MPTYCISLNTPAPQSFSEEIEKRLFFVSSEIIDFKLKSDSGQIRQIEVVTQHELDEKELAEKINFVVKNDVLTQKIFAPKIIWRSGSQREYVADIFDRLVEQDIAFAAGEGQIAFGEPLISLLAYFDGKIKSLVKSLFDGVEYRYPTVIPTRVVNDCGYFSSFPHMLMVVTRFHSDVNNYRAFAEEYREKKTIDFSLIKYCANTDYCLPPTMCYHTYHQLRGKVVKNRVITARGKSFRYESRYHRAMERLWDFTIREIVFLGTKDFVLECRQKFMEAVLAFIDELKLQAFCEVANDPFFCRPDTAVKIFSQRMMELKYELRMNIDPMHTISVGSFNYHEQFFAENFTLKSPVENELIFTGCAGFGLERLVYAFLCQYGLDREQWPGDV
ncbi:MAG: hypothetical protein L0Y73_01585, partial [Candidatus Aminicenantes bacterium]|nr:hypothetical protein [Candidatus Aminicenantes bacterium]